MQEFPEGNLQRIHPFDVLVLLAGSNGGREVDAIGFADVMEIHVWFWNLARADWVAFFGSVTWRVEAWRSVIWETLQ